MDTAQWPQEIIVKPLEEIVTNTCSKPQPPQPQQPPQTVGAVGEEKKLARPEKTQAVNCPRCNSTNTKFCYYNNYSLTQPRYFCKGCRRYWTEGGTLRNIPVGGGSRKNKRSHHSSSISSSSNITQQATKKHLSNHHHHQLMNMTSHQNPKFFETNQQDLNLGFSPHGLIRTNFTDLIHNIGDKNNTNSSMFASATSAMLTSSLDLIRNNNTNGNSSSFMGFQVHDNHQDSTTSREFSMQDHYKPCNNTNNTTLLGFSLDHHNDNNGFHHGGFQGGDHQDQGEGHDHTNNGKHLFPFEDLKLPISSSSTSINVDINDHERRGSGGDASTTTTSGGYWTGMLSGGSWC